jgi:hypothetical protein
LPFEFRGGGGAQRGQGVAGNVLGPPGHLGLDEHYVSAWSGKIWNIFAVSPSYNGTRDIFELKHTTKLMENPMKITLKMIPTKLFLSFLVALGTASVAFAQGEVATGDVSGQPSGSVYDYTITLNNNSGSVSIGSLWYAWTPTISPFFYLPSPPTSASAPVGWTASIVANSIQYVDSGTPLVPGQSIQFQYVASFTPAQLTGNAGYSYVYSGGIEGDPGAFVNIQTVAAPEPSSLGLLMAGFLGLTLAGRRKLRKLAVVA